MANTIQVPGTFDAIGAGKKLAEASQIYDGNKKQSEINEGISTQVNGKYTKPSGGIPVEDLSDDVKASLSKANTAIQQHQDISGKADKADTYTKAQVDAAIADIDVTEQLGDYAKKTDVSTAVAAETTRAQGVEATKANSADVTASLASKADKTEVTTGLAGKQDTISDLATIRSGAALGATAKQPATTIAGYGITDAYTKQEVNNLVSTPHQQYVTVATKADLDAITTGSADTIYRVSNYDGTQVDATKYAEYAWDGTGYTLLSVKSAVGEVFDVSEYNIGATYETLAQALAAVPTTAKRGGMSIKYIQLIPATYSVVRTDNVEDAPAGTDIQEDWAIVSGTYTAAQLSGKTLPTTVGNSITYYRIVEETVEVPEHFITWEITKATNDSTKYVQYRYMGTATDANFTNVTNWQGVDDKLTAGSRNLVEGEVVFNKLMDINGNININRSTPGGRIGSWGLAGKNILLKGKSYNIFNTEDSSATSFNLFDEQGNQVYTNQGVAKNKTITITPSVDIFRIAGYTGGQTLDIRVTENGNMLEALNNTISDVVELQKDLGVYVDIEKHASSGSSVGSWNVGGNFKAGTYKVFNDTYSYTSLIFYNKDNAEIYRNENLARGRASVITLSQDAVRVAGYGSNTQYGLVKLSIVTKDSANDKIFYLENVINEVNSSISGVKNEVWSIDGAFCHVYRTPQSGSSVGSWEVRKDFKAGTYLIKNAIGSYGSINFYAQDGSTIYSNQNIPRDTTFNVVLQQDAVRVSGYNATVNSITDIIIVGKDTMESRLETIEENKDICILNPPSQYDNLIYNNIRSKRIDDNLKKLFTLVHFSDIHGIVDNVARLSKFVGRYKSEIADIICTGDIVADRYEDTNILDNYPNILALIGNHDAWLRTYNAELAEYQAGPWVVKQSYCYDKFIANSVANWEVTQPSDVETTKKCYYYKDYQQADSKLRVICLDCMHYNIGADLDANNNSIQNAWLSDVLTDAINNNIPVVIAVHYWPAIVSLTNEEVIKCAYSTTDYIGSDYLPGIAIRTVQSFIDNGGEFVCWIVGHAHCDLIAAPRDYPKQMFIAVDCATYVNSVGNSARVKNTRTQDCFNIITFDTYDKLVKVVRVGNDTTRQLKQKRVLAYRYAPITDGAGILHNIGLEYCG